MFWKMFEKPAGLVWPSVHWGEGEGVEVDSYPLDTAHVKKG